MKRSVKLIHSINGVPATPQNCDMKIGHWYSDGMRLSVNPKDDKNVSLITDKGEYNLIKNVSQNYFCGECNGHKVHVILRPMVGEVIFW